MQSGRSTPAVQSWAEHLQGCSIPQDQQSVQQYAQAAEKGWRRTTSAASWADYISRLGTHPGVFFWHWYDHRCSQVVPVCVFPYHSSLLFAWLRGADPDDEAGFGHCHEWWWLWNDQVEPRFHVQEPPISGILHCGLGYGRGAGYYHPEVRVQA